MRPHMARFLSRGAGPLPGAPAPAERPGPGPGVGSGIDTDPVPIVLVPASPRCSTTPGARTGGSTSWATWAGPSSPSSCWGTGQPPGRPTGGLRRGRGAGGRGLARPAVRRRRLLSRGRHLVTPGRRPPRPDPPAGPARPGGQRLLGWRRRSDHQGPPGRGRSRGHPGRAVPPAGRLGRQRPGGPGGIPLAPGTGPDRRRGGHGGLPGAGGVRGTRTSSGVPIAWSPPCPRSSWCPWPGWTTSPPRRISGRSTP